MIPLGSCTMKLNATAEMIRSPGRNSRDLHPFAPAEQARAITRCSTSCRDKLCDITGYDAISLQPNSGAQGEYAGLLAIRGYHAARGDAASQGLPDPLLRARHQSGLRRRWRHGGGGGRLRRARQRRRRRSARQGREAFATDLAA